MRGALACVTAILFAACAASADTIDLNKLETKDLRLLYFDPTETYLTPYVARAYENSLAFQQRTFGWTPWEKPTIFLKDFGDYGNAGVRSSPNNALYLDIAPVAQTFETFSSGERFFTLMNHELVHFSQMDTSNDEDAWWRHFFHGKPLPISDHPETILYNYLATPRINVPRWYLEGGAVFMETWMGGGLGRAQGAYDEMVFRAMVRDNARFYDPLALESEGTSVDFQVGVNDYLYGTRFVSYLALQYSPEQVIEWYKRGKDSDRYYSNQFERVFGRPLNAVWQDWIDWEHGFQRANLASVEKFPVTQTRRLTDRALGSVSRSFFDPGTESLIGGFRYPGVIAHIGVLSLKDGSVRRLADIKGPAIYRVTSLAYDPQHNRAWYTTNNYAYRDLMEIDLASGQTRMLIKGGRVGDLVFDPKDESLWGLRHFNGLVTLVRSAPPYTEWNQICTFPYGRILFDLDISADGTLLSTSMGEINGDQGVDIFRIADLMNGNFAPTASFSMGISTPEGFVFSPDDRYLFGSAYYTGVSNIYRYELATGKLEAVSNAVTGLFRPIPRPDGSLIAYEYTGQGFVPVSIDPKPLNDLGAITFLGSEVARKHPIVKNWAVGSPAKIPLDSMITATGKYDSWAETRLEATYPIVLGYKGHAAFGWSVLLEDPLQFNQLFANVAYSPAGDLRVSEQWHADIEYHTILWHLQYWHNSADFYDLFGPVDRSRKGDAILAGYKTLLVFDPPRQMEFTADTAYYMGLDTLPGAQNVHGSDRNIVSGKLGLHYTDTDRSLGAVDYEKGFRWNIDAGTDYADREVFPKIRGGFDFGFTLPWNHSSLWLYSAAGMASGAHLNPLNAFYFGAFGNNYVDDGEVKRYRTYDSFPGFKIDEIAARDFAKSMLEWNLPPVRFGDVGTPSIYLSSARTALFAGVLAADPGRATSATVETAGLQVDWNFTIALRLPMTFSVGYAHGFGDSALHGREEILASLKIL